MKATAALAIAAIALTAGCGSTTGGTTAAAPPSAQEQATAASSPTCLDQAEAWRNAGASDQLKAIGTDSGNVSDASRDLITAIDDNADPSDAEASMQAAAASLSADVGAARTNLPPTCIPGLRTHESAALTDYARGANDCQNAISALSSSSYSLAAADMVASTKAEDAGNAKLGQASDDLGKFNNS